LKRETMSRQVSIEPNCIFCGSLTSNAETRRVKTGQRKDAARKTTITSYVDIPFPAHARCYKKKKRAAWWGAVIFVSPILLVIIALLGMIAVNLVQYGTWNAPPSNPPVSPQDTDETGSSWLGCVITLVAVIGGPAYSYWVSKRLDRQILDYYYTHVER
jgi:hypothetical protein